MRKGSFKWVKSIMDIGLYCVDLLEFSVSLPWKNSKTGESGESRFVGMFRDVLGKVEFFATDEKGIAPAGLVDADTITSFTIPDKGPIAIETCRLMAAQGWFIDEDSPLLKYECTCGNCSDEDKAEVREAQAQALEAIRSEVGTHQTPKAERARLTAENHPENAPSTEKAEALTMPEDPFL